MTIREAMISMKKEIVNDVLQELNPRLNELEDLLKEVKNDIATKNGEIESESDSENEEMEEKSNNIIRHQKINRPLRIAEKKITTIVGDPRMGEVGAVVIRVFFSFTTTRS